LIARAQTDGPPRIDPIASRRVREHLGGNFARRRFKFRQNDRVAALLHFGANEVFLPLDFGVVNETTLRLGELDRFFDAFRQRDGFPFIELFFAQVGGPSVLFREPSKSGSGERLIFGVCVDVSGYCRKRRFPWLFFRLRFLASFSLRFKSRLFRRLRVDVAGFARSSSLSLPDVQGSKRFSRDVRRMGRRERRKNRR